MNGNRIITVILYLIAIGIICGIIIYRYNSSKYKKLNETLRQNQYQAKLDVIKERDKQITIYEAMIENNRKEAKVRVTGKMRDQDLNEYNTVKIGNQEWMAENMRATHDRYGNPIELGESDEKDTGAPYRFNALGGPLGSSTDLKRNGYLYNWEAAMNICPNGWHLPTDEEWKQLEEYVSSQSKYVCGKDKKNIAKALADTIGWPNKTEIIAEKYRYYLRSSGSIGSLSTQFGSIADYPKANNGTGFSACPAMHEKFGECRAFFWSATENENMAYSRTLYESQADLGRSTYEKYFGLSVRCIKD